MLRSSSIPPFASHHPTRVRFGATRSAEATVELLLLGGLGGVSLISQLIGTALGILVALLGGFAVYGVIKALHGLRLSQEEEYYGADLSLHKIGAVSQD
mgnify:CR=1 FL=1